MTDARDRGRLQFSLRTMLAATALCSVLFGGMAVLGLVEVLDLVLFASAGLIALAVWRDAMQQQRRPYVFGMMMLHAGVTILTVFAANLLVGERMGLADQILDVISWILMCPLALVHHLLCRYLGWHSGLAQPGTFCLVVVLNSLFWVRAGHYGRLLVVSRRITESNRPASLSRD